MVLNMPFIAMGAFTILDEPVVIVIPSKIPAELADKKSAIKKKIDA